MSYREEEQVRLKRQRTKRAIGLAMQGQWGEAIIANKEIIASYHQDVDAHNRLGRAYMELGEYPQAREAYQRALKLDPYNPIAKKNLQRLSHLGETAISSEGDYHTVEPQHFIEETGKTGVVDLYQLAPPGVLARMVAGDRVHVKIQGASLIVENSRGEYLGIVGPRNGQRLIKLMEGGNKYSAAVISSEEDKLTLIIKEVYQDPSQAGRLSFPMRLVKGVPPYVSDRLVKRELDYEEELVEEAGYTLIGGETDTLIEELPDVNDAPDNVGQGV